MLHEDLARLRVNEAIRTGLESQRVHRAIESQAEGTYEDRSLAGARRSAPLQGLHIVHWIRNVLRAAKRVAGIA